MADASPSARESLLLVADELQKASKGSLDAAVAALRDGTAAIEYHLDTLARETVPGALRIPAELLPHARSIETRLRALLVRCWEAEKQFREGDGRVSHLAQLAQELADVAEDDLQLVFDSFHDTGSLD